MAYAPSLSIEPLTALAVGKLARLVLDGAEGLKTVAALVDKRFSGLKRAHGFVEWEKAKKTNAYGLGARYLAKLDDLKAELDAALPDVASHATFRAEIVKKNARKAGFWAI